MDLSIVIVNWNSTGYARECIRSIYEHTTGIRFEVIVVDNGSPADDVDGLRDEFPEITLVKSGENLGFARANNLGVTRATGEVLLFLNPDTKLMEPALEAMVEALRSRPDAGAVGCKLLNGDLSVQTSCIQSFPTILNQALDADVLRKRWPGSRLWGTAALTAVTSEPVPVEVVSGACLMIRGDVFAEIGMFSEAYFMYAEDLDLCRKAVRAGYRNYHTGAARLIHYGGRSSTPEAATIMKWRSILHYCEKQRGKAYALLFRAAMALAAICRLGILAAGAAVKRPVGRAEPGLPAAEKWKTILGTLVKGAGSAAAENRGEDGVVPEMQAKGLLHEAAAVRYVIVTPVRDEAANLPRTIASVAAQTVLPVEWIIVNDGSSDETGAIIDEAAGEFSWVHGVQRPNRGFRKPGGGVVEAFQEGYAAIRNRGWDFLVKLDGDLSFGPDYFEKCFERFQCEPGLGVGGGLICNLVDGEMRVEESPAFHVRGATKIYRRACWDRLGGLWPAPGWDTIDEVKALRLGWKTQTFREVRIVQHRPTGQADGAWRVLVKYGRANYIAGYHPLFMLCKCARRLARKPYGIGSLGLLYGFVGGYLKRVPQFEDKATIGYLRQQQMNRLLGSPSIWR